MSDLTKSASPKASQTFKLRTLTPARVALSQTGSSIATHNALDFTLAHAQARDAVRAALSIPSLLSDLRQRGLNPITLKSAASDRMTYLRRPDLGRQLSEASAIELANQATPENRNTLTIILADGLSALAVDRHGIPLLDALLPLLKPHFQLTPIIIAEQARVAIGDQIGKSLRASLSIVLIGERPGLSFPDSLGAYITWNPQPGRTDAERNCISNIHTQGLDYTTAAVRISFLSKEAQRLQLTGTTIKEEDPSAESTSKKLT